VQKYFKPDRIHKPHFLFPFIKPNDFRTMFRTTTLSITNHLVQSSYHHILNVFCTLYFSEYISAHTSTWISHHLKLSLNKNELPFTAVTTSISVNGHTGLLKEQNNHTSLLPCSSFRIFHIIQADTNMETKYDR